MNARDAKKVRDQRATLEFKSLSDIEGIPNIAKTSLKKIKDYIIHQQYKEVELTGMPHRSAPQQKEKKDAGRTTSTRKKKGSQKLGK